MPSTSDTDSHFISLHVEPSTSVTKYFKDVGNGLHIDKLAKMGGGWGCWRETYMIFIQGSGVCIPFKTRTSIHFLNLTLWVLCPLRALCQNRCKAELEQNKTSCEQAFGGSPRRPGGGAGAGAQCLRAT